MVESESGYYESLYEAAAALNSARAPEAVLRSMVENVVRAVRAKGCSLLLLTPDRKQLLYTAAYGLSDRYVKKGPILADRSLAEALVGDPVAVYDATTDARIQYRDEAKQEGIASILSVPMMLREEIIGVVRVYTADLRRFTMDDMYFVGAVANLGAIALENARLYDSVKKDYDALRSDMLGWRNSLGEEWIYTEFYQT
jgi:GAF domain-containing protein